MSNGPRRRRPRNSNNSVSHKLEGTAYHIYFVYCIVLIYTMTNQLVLKNVSSFGIQTYDTKISHLLRSNMVRTFRFHHRQYPCRPLSSTTTSCSNDNDHQEQPHSPQNGHSSSSSASSTILYNQRYDLLQKSSKLSLAPMMDYTDRHFRHLIRCISSQTLLYTEMVAANAICHENQFTIEQQQYPNGIVDNTNINQYNGNDEAPINYENSYLLRYLQQGCVEPLEGASVLQLGGSNPQQMYDAAATIMELTRQGYCNYTAINLNCGCPSPKVAGKGCFGAALMQEAPLVSQLTKALYEGSAGTMPITVKCRIGTDSKDDPFRISTYQSNEEAEYNKLCDFIETVASNHVVTDFAVHARIAVIHRSFSPADNRKIPPLQYNVVRQLVQDFPHLQFTLNGGINTLSQVQRELQQSINSSDDRKLQGIMVGRAFAADPWSFAMSDELLYGESPTPTTKKNRLQVLQQYGIHADAEEERLVASGGEVQNVRRFIVKAVTPLFAGEMNAKKYRIALDEITKLPKHLKRLGKTISGQPPISELIINAAIDHLSEETLLRSPEESYERVLHEERKQQTNSFTIHSTTSSNYTSTSGRSATVDEWQQLRKIEELEHPGSYENAIATGI